VPVLLGAAEPLAEVPVEPLLLAELPPAAPPPAAELPLLCASAIVAANIMLANNPNPYIVCLIFNSFASSAKNGCPARWISTRARPTLGNSQSAHSLPA
jgi:hypothetical protein